MHMVDIDNSASEESRYNLINDVSQTCWETNV